MTTKIIYLRRKDTGKPFFNPFYYKCVDKDYLQVMKDEIEINSGEDFHDNVSFIKNKLEEEQWEEITREQFDAFYKKTVSRINQISKL